MTHERPKHRRWFQFRLRTLLIAVVVLTLPLSWFAVRIEKAKIQREIVEMIERRGGAVLYDSGIASGMRVKQTWLRGLFGNDVLDTVIEVHLWGSGTSDVDLEQLTRLTSLQSLSLPCTDVTDAGLAQLESMANLEELVLGGTRITNAGLVHLRGLTNLKQLNLFDTQVTDAGLVHLKGLTNLERLDLSFTQVTGGGLKHLKELSGLHIIDLSFTQVTDAGVVDLKGLTNLQYLILSGTFVTFVGVDELLEALPDCQITYENLGTTHDSDLDSVWSSPF